MIYTSSKSLFYSVNLSQCTDTLIHLNYTNVINTKIQLDLERRIYAIIDF